MKTDLTDRFKYFLKGYGVKSMAEYNELTQIQRKQLSREYLRVNNTRTYPLGENGVGKKIQQFVDGMKPIE